MARAGAKRSEPEPTEPLAVIEAYAQEDIVRNSGAFLDIVERVVAGWGIAIQERITLVTQRPIDVVDAASCERVELSLKDAKELEADSVAFWKPRKNLFDRVHSIICGGEKRVLGTLPTWRATAIENLTRFRREEERQRQARERELAEIAQREEQARLQREAELLEQQGHPELAQQVIEQAIASTAPVVVVASTAPQTKGISYRENWKWRPIGGDTPANRARVEKLVPREFLELSEKKLNAYVKAHRDSVRIPGIEFYDAGSVSVRS